MEAFCQIISPRIQIIIVMGVSGAGKTTIGSLLARSLGWPFYEGDDFHSQANINQMGHGIPLNDEDRKPWLAKLKRLIQSLINRSQCAVISCSALKQAYRDYLTESNSHVVFVHLKGSESLIRSRMLQRDAHFMSEDLLTSQLSVLDEPEDALTLDLMSSPNSLVEQIKRNLRL